MIILKDIQPFARGGKRECFVHPEHRDRCVKTSRPDFLPADLKRNAPWLRSIRKSVDSFDESATDWKVLNALAKSGDKDVWNHIPKFYGWSQTDRGRGLVIELLRDEDGLISRTLLDVLWERGYDSALRRAVDELAAFWEVRTIPSRSLGLHNIVAQLQPGGRIRLVVIDGLGNTVFFSFSRWIRAYALRRARSKVDGLRQDIETLLEQRMTRTDPGFRGFLLSRE